MAWVSTPQSSVMAGFAYHEATQVLTIGFRSGSRYDYHEVPELVAKGLQRASSKGHFHAEYIRDVYRYTRAE